ncbi:hypothetical protein [Streptomyces virginiae]|uniref:hypothetical protein n=1 Tax=Streptomyces virginiae TaxID=1961 RepID=UPI00342674F8
MSMVSIKTYTGPVTLCSRCGQPSFTDDEIGHQHFMEQWDGIHCPRYPLAGEPITMNWNQMSLDQIKAGYPDTYPYSSLSAGVQA